MTWRGTESLERYSKGHQIDEKEEETGNDRPPVKIHEHDADGGDTEQGVGEEAGEELEQEVETHPDSS